MKSIQQLIPRSRVNLSYHTMVEGQLREVELPFRVIVLADLSHGSSTDRELDMETRRLRNLDGKNIDELMANMKITVSLKAKNFIDPEVEQLGSLAPRNGRIGHDHDVVELEVSMDDALFVHRQDAAHQLQRPVVEQAVRRTQRRDAAAQIGRGRDRKMVERLRERKVIQRPEDLGIDPLDADRRLLAARSIKDIVRKSRMGSFEVSKMLYRLRSIKLVRRRVLPVAV